MSCKCFDFLGIPLSDKPVDTPFYLKTTFFFVRRFRHSNDSETKVASTSSGYKVTLYLPLDTWLSWLKSSAAHGFHAVPGLGLVDLWLMQRVITFDHIRSDDGDDDDDDDNDDDDDENIDDFMMMVIVVITGMMMVMTYCMT